MHFKFNSRFQHKAQIDITSLIDLVFLLVAFFMVTSTLVNVSSITVHLPKAMKAGEYKYNDLIISIDERDDIYINDIKCDVNSLLGELKKRKISMKGGSVIIRGDRKARYETIVQVMDYLNQAGLPKFTLSIIKLK